MKRMLLVILVTMLLPQSLQASFWGPSSYDECVVDEAKSFTGPVPVAALRSIRRICQERFPDPAPVEANACIAKNDTSRKRWSHVITATKFRFMTASQRENARTTFFDNNVSKLATEKVTIEELRKWWDRQTYPARYVPCK
ncbi:hypothetical protein [Porticoccus sp.]|uniref:hypothetical protein n=1 Tax=Porticoccus sp. TaxID=2024853 RepID=UPI0039E22EC6